MTYFDRLKSFQRLVRAELPAAVAAALVALIIDETPNALEKAWQSWQSWQARRDDSSFCRIAENETGTQVVICNDCEVAAYDHDVTCVANGDAVCNDCLQQDYVYCDSCRYYCHADDSQTVNGGDRTYCDSCVANYCHRCDSCEEWSTSYTQTVGGAEYCSYCLESYCSYCDECDEWYCDGDTDDHDHSGCDCVAPFLKFSFPNNGKGLVRQNERFLVELPKGTIDEEGICAIRNLLIDAGHDYYRLTAVLEAIGNEWQTKAGNYTRRLSAALYKGYGEKLAPAIVSEVGNIARAHSSSGSDWRVELTRDVNGTAADFYHEGSCWWGSHAVSRCCLKSWGGIGIRTYHGDETDRRSPSGRAWVQPLNGELLPTHATNDAFAYVVFNGYGDLSGYVAARIVAYLTGKTYKRVSLAAENQYVNGDTGYLVADEATCANDPSLFFDFDPHDTREEV